ncbi:MAG: alpha/beta hydrolase, partial [Ilumatobacteraceae bacterium]
MTARIPGADPMSHVGSGPHGALVIHGFTGHCGSMRILADAFAAEGWHVEMPLLPGHGTAVDDMLPTRWADWAGEAERAYRSLAARADMIVVVCLSMGGALTLRVGADHPEVAGLVCINPAAQPQAAEVIEMLQGMVDGGTEVIPGIGSDIADPDSNETAYDGTPLRPLISMLVDGVAPVAAGSGCPMHPRPSGCIWRSATSRWRRSAACRSPPRTCSSGHRSGSADRRVAGMTRRSAASPLPDWTEERRPAPLDCAKHR